MHDVHADALPRAGQVSVEERIRHVARDGVDRSPPRGEIRAAELPVAQVPGDEDEPFTASQPLFDDAPAVDRLEQTDDLRSRIGWQNRRLDRRAAEVGVRGARDALDLGGVSLRGNAAASCLETTTRRMPSGA